METYEKFRARHPKEKQLGNFSDSELATLDKKLPADIINFLKEEGRASYSNNTLWTIHPAEFHEILSDWGLDGNKCYAFIRTAFGGCIYYTKKKFYSFDSLTGIINNLNDDVYTLMSVYLTFDFLLHDTWHLQYLENRTDLPAIQADEIYGLVPALSFGGSFETSALEVVKMREHLAFLAELFDNKVQKL
jgi:hypothetical protein